MSHFDSAESIATNTLLIPNIPTCFFGSDDAMLLIHDACAAFGPLYTFVKMKGFGRLMVIYRDTVNAIKAKQQLDRNHLIWKEREPFPEIISLTKLDETDIKTWVDLAYKVLDVRVYYGQHCAVDEDPSHSQLQVPQFERNMLISPPGSPFDDWKQIAEDPPNQSVLASDMMHAADVSDYELDDDELDLDNSNDSSPVLEEPPQMKTRESTSRFTIVCAKGTDTPDHLPAITVQDWDGQVNIQVDEDDNQLGTGQIARTKKSIKDLKPTSMPPQ